MQQESSCSRGTHPGRLAAGTNENGFIMTKTFADDIEKMSYAMGINVGEYVLKSPLKVNPELVLEGLKDVLAGTPGLSPEEYAKAMQELQAKMQQAGQDQMKKAAEGNIKAGTDFLAENKKKDGVKVTDSGLQYQVITEGSGAKPAKTQKVRVHYTGKLLNGTVFDSSVERGEPAEFMLNQVIPGWTEGVQLMSEGSKYRFFIPSELAYGDRGAGNVIPPGAALIFDVELLKVL